MKTALSLALLPILFMTVSPACAEERTDLPWSDYQRCVKNETGKMVTAPASATEIAQAALHRCGKEATDYWSYYYLNFGRNKESGERADKELARREKALSRMAVSLVIDARSQSAPAK